MTTYKDTGTFGIDISCINDITPGLTVISGIDGLKQSCFRRLTTPPGGLLTDPNYGTDVREWINSTFTSPQYLESQVVIELSKDERVNSVTCEASYNEATKVITLDILVETNQAPFSLTLSINEVTGKVLLGE